MKSTVADHITETITALRQKAARFTTAADQLEALSAEFGWSAAAELPPPDPDPVPAPRRGRKPVQRVLAARRVATTPSVRRGAKEAAVRRCIAVFAGRGAPFTSPALLEQARTTAPEMVERWKEAPADIPSVLIKLIANMEVERTGKKIGVAPEYRATKKFTEEGRTLSGTEQLHRQIRSEIAEKHPQPQD